MKLIFSENEPRSVNDLIRFVGCNVIVTSEDYTIDAYLLDIEYIGTDQSTCHLLLRNSIGSNDYFEASYKILSDGIESIESIESLT